ncbi:MAG: DNA translocase FtsK 4TM domain-containing protein [Rhodospirillales bacterium]|nr:DNA translocase FtsK 4TM domain-containing protein [Rhodospirillales bacterium]
MARLTMIGPDSVLPVAVRAWMSRRLSELTGMTLIMACAVALAALFSYDPADPSWNHITDAAAHNLLGRFGAFASDAMVQTAGVAILIPVITLAVWGWRLMHKRSVPLLRLRLPALVAATALVAAALALLPTPHAWPFATGSGGLIGFLLLQGIARFGQALHPALAATGLALGCGIGGAVLWSWALVLSRGEWQALARLLTDAVRAVPRIGGEARRILASARSLVSARSLWLAHRQPAFAPPRPSLVEDPADALAPSSTRAAARDRDDEDLIAPKAPKISKGRKSDAGRQPQFAFDADYRPPPLDLLRAPPRTRGSEGINRDSLEQNALMLSSVLEDFGVRGDIVKVRPGPVVTLYELEPAAGTKTSRVIGLADDIARSMSAVSARVAVVVGRNVIGIELPNSRHEMVYLRELLSAEAFERHTGQLVLALGKDIGGGPVFVDLARMPHLLIAGTTGSGKSVAINTMILSLLYRRPPDVCKLILIDPKMLELSVYDGIPHLLAPVVTDPAKAVVALKWTVREMEERYRMMSQLGVRNIAGFNARVVEARDKGEKLVRRVQTGFDDDGRPVVEEQPLDLEPLPFIVVVVDEMANLMLVAGKDIEAAVQRLAQMARAAGIHLIMATQRPSVDVITGTIKANFPTRISFHVTSKIDSRTILGEQGAEQLLGQGDMLYMATGGRITRVHGPFVSDEEVEDVVRDLRDQGEPQYVQEVTEGIEEDAAWITGEIGEAGGPSGDDLYDEAVAIVSREGKASTSFVQRRLQIGYNRAARLIERMEAEGLVSKPDRVGRREVLVGERAV